MTEPITMKGVREYMGDNISVRLNKVENPDGKERWIIEAFNEGGYNSTEVDLEDLLEWLAVNDGKHGIPSPNDYYS